MAIFAKNVRLNFDNKEENLTPVHFFIPVSGSISFLKEAKHLHFVFFDLWTTSPSSNLWQTSLDEFRFARGSFLPLDFLAAKK